MTSKHNLNPKSKIRIKEDIMEEKSELNDIILNRGSSSNKSKKMILSVGIFALLLIVIVVVISSFSPNNSNLPQAVLPPEPSQNEELIADDPLFESVDVIDESLDNDTNIIDEVTKKIKEESLAEHREENVIVETIEDPIVKEVKDTKEEEMVVVIDEPIKAVPQKTRLQFPKSIEKPRTSKPVHVEPTHNTAPKAIQKGNYYVQVGSFSKSKPDTKLINDIKSHGFSYTFQKINRSGKSFNKVLVGPFNNETKARKALKVIRKDIINGAFLTKV